MCRLEMVPLIRRSGPFTTMSQSADGEVWERSRVRGPAVVCRRGRSTGQRRPQSAVRTPAQRGSPGLRPAGRPADERESRAGGAQLRGAGERRGGARDPGADELDRDDLGPAGHRQQRGQEEADERSERVDADSSCRWAGPASRRANQAELSGCWRCGDVLVGALDSEWGGAHGQNGSSPLGREQVFATRPATGESHPHAGGRSRETGRKALSCGVMWGSVGSCWGGSSPGHMSAISTTGFVLRFPLDCESPSRRASSWGGGSTIASSPCRSSSGQG